MSPVFLLVAPMLDQKTFRRISEQRCKGKQRWELGDGSGLNSSKSRSYFCSIWTEKVLSQSSFRLFGRNMFYSRLSVLKFLALQVWVDGHLGQQVMKGGGCWTSALCSDILSSCSSKCCQFFVQQVVLCASRKSKFRKQIYFWRLQKTWNFCVYVEPHRTHTHIHM